jgi:hypothetical protein
MHRCVECHDLLPKAELMVFDGFYSCPQCKPLVVKKIARGEAVGAVFRYGADRIVVRKGAVLPNTCAKCNAPAGRFGVPQGIWWKVAIGLCPVHRRRRTLFSLLGGIILTLGIFAFPYFMSAANSASVPTKYWGGAAAWGSVLVTGSATIGLSRNFRTRRLSRNEIVIKGLHPDYVAQFPEWPGDHSKSA